MAVKIKFPLNMADGTQTRTIEELREHFDLASVLSYYSNGKLINWLESRYYDEEARKIKALDSASEHFKTELCAILGVNYSDHKEDNVELKDIEKKNERIEMLKKYTDDDTILAALDRVAFSQEDLDKLVGEGVKEIYLLGEQFTISSYEDGITYIGVNKPKFSLSSTYAEDDIVFKNMDTLSYIYAAIESEKGGISAEMVEALTEAAEKGCAEAQYYLGDFYCYGSYIGDYGYYNSESNESFEDYVLGLAADEYERYHDEYERQVKEYYKKAIKWYKMAAEQGNADAQCGLGRCYLRGEGVEEDEEEAKRWYYKGIEQYKLLAEQGDLKTQGKLGDVFNELEDYSEAVKWYRKAAEQGDICAQNMLAEYYEKDKVIEKDENEAKKWFDKTIEEYIASAENGNMEAQLKLGDIYFNGYDVEKNYSEAIKWYRKAAKKGNARAQCILGNCYLYGYGIGKDYVEARKWYQKAAFQGNEEAKDHLDKLLS